MNPRKALSLLIASLAVPLQVSALSRSMLDLPDLGPPPQGTVQWVARDMRMNGLPMTLQTFESRLGPETVLSHYEFHTKTLGSHESRRTTNGPWQVLMLRSRDHFITVHARAVVRGSEGTILVSPALEPASLRLQTRFPRPASTRVVNLQQYDDAGMAAEHISLMSERAPFTELQAFSQLLIAEDWTVIDTRPTFQVQRGYVLEAQRQSEQALIVLTPNASQAAGTFIAIVWKK